MAIWQWVKQSLQPQEITEPAPAYDAWSGAYDHQPGNLMLDLDETLVADFIDRYRIEDKTIADVGCGTGRHWNKFIDKSPRKLSGFDVSRGMLARLKEKFPEAETMLLKNNRLEGMVNRSCDLIVSTLTIAHIGDVADALGEWNRILKPGGSVFITDYHPRALSKGGLRTFKHEGKTIAVRNHIHPLNRLREIFRQLGWEEQHFEEKMIDESVKDYYTRQNALHLYEKFKGIPIIYAIELKKKDDPA